MYPSRFKFEQAPSMQPDIELLSVQYIVVKYKISRNQWDQWQDPNNATARIISSPRC